MNFTKPTREGQHALIAMYGASGSGKTYSALLMAKGLAGGDMSKVVLIDTENGRGTHYCDDTQVQGYQYGAITAPYNPTKFDAAIKSAVSAGFKVIVIDSLTHEWEGEGGVLDMAAANEERTGKAGLHNWAKPKKLHTSLVQSLMLTNAHVIVCMRGKEKKKQVGFGKQAEIISAGFLPIQSEDVLFEMLASFQIEPDNTIKVVKCSHQLRGGLISDGVKITPEHGKVFLNWLERGAAKQAVDTAPPQGFETWQDWVDLTIGALQNAETLVDAENIISAETKKNCAILKNADVDLYNALITAMKEAKERLAPTQQTETEGE
jgi:hypothetical protein